MISPDLFINEWALEEHGYTILPGLISSLDLAEFEQVIAELCAAELKRRGIRCRHADPFIDVMIADQEYRRYLFPLLRRFHIVERISADIGAWLTQCGFLARQGYRAPLIWPYFRADLPNETTYELAFHQDVVSTESTRAWRIWLPLRAVDRHYGSMELVSGSHKLGWLDHRKEGKLEVLIDDALIPEEKRVCIEAEAGSAVLLNPSIIHRSVPNRSERVKFIILIQVQDGAELRGPLKQESTASSVSKS
jgi:hypothetical protein